MSTLEFVSHSRPTSRKRTIVLAEAAGFCFGVRRAVDIALRAREESNSAISTLGPIVHNGQVTARLMEAGIGLSRSVGAAGPGVLVISAHGASPQVRESASARGLKLLDATCPYVTKVHRSARQLHEQGYQIVLVGDPGHTEVEGVVGAIQGIGGSITVVSCASDLSGAALGRKVGVISQTTQYTETFARVVAEVCRRAVDVRAVNTVCGATEELQKAAVEMSKRVEVAIVIGGSSSSNSRRLREICASTGIPAYQIETADEIDEAWLEGKSVIGITAGASTPDWAIEDVARRLNDGELPCNWKLAHPEEK